MKTKKIKAEALKYDTKTKFAKGSPGAYKMAKKLNIFDEVTSHMIAINKSYTNEELINTALKYDTRESFKECDSKAYHMCYYRKISKEAFSHMIGKRTWTEDELKNEASKYNSKADFKTGSNSAYITAHRRGIFEDICSHMVDERKYWSDDDLYEDALTYETIKEYKKKSKGYDVAYKRGILDDMTAHMVRGKTGLDPAKPAILYYLSINDGQAYKIGITSRTVTERYLPRDMKKIKVLFTIEFERGLDAREEEKKILAKYSEFKYTGDKILTDGNTELFVCDVLKKDYK